MIAVGPARAGLDSGPPAGWPAERAPAAGAAPTGRLDAYAESVTLSRGARLLAALEARHDDAHGLARGAGNESGADPSNDPTARLRKLYPPYPPEYKDRVAYLDGLAGLGRQNHALMRQAELAMDGLPESELGILEVGRSAASALAGRADQGLTGNPAGFAQFLGEGHT